MNKKDLQKILQEELANAINEEELDEQGFASKIGGFLKGLNRRGDDLRNKRLKSKKEPQQEKPQAVDTDEEEPSSSSKTISLTKDIFPDLMSDIPAQDRHKLTKLVQKLKNSSIIGKKISNSQYKNLKDERSKIYAYSKQLTKALDKAASKNSSLASQMSRVYTTEKVKDKIEKAAKIVDIDPQIIKYILNDIEDNITLVETIVESIIKENLKGNRVIL